MLMQNFRSAVELGISEEQKSALEKTLVLLETGKLKHVTEFEVLSFDCRDFTGHFNMADWNTKTDCGTVCCIGGTAEMVGGVSFSTAYEDNPALFNLFFPYALGTGEWLTLKDAQAARALRSYLNCGDSKWGEAVALEPNQMEVV